MNQLKVPFFAMIIAAATGCSAQAGDESAANEASGANEEVASGGEALSATSCIASSVTPNKTLTKIWGLGEGVISPSSYGQPGCDAYLVDVKDYASFPSSQYWNYAINKGDDSSQSLCERTQVRAYFWTKSAGASSFTFFDAQSRWGIWDKDHRLCITYLRLEDLGNRLPAHATVRYAIKAQLHDTAGDPNSNYSLRSVMMNRDNSFGALPLPPRN